jgi:hypothetical protein
LFDIVVGETGREDRCSIEGLSGGYDIRTIDEGALIVSEEGKLDHSSAEL